MFDRTEPEAPEVTLTFDEGMAFEVTYYGRSDGLKRVAFKPTVDSIPLRLGEELTVKVSSIIREVEES